MATYIWQKFHYILCLLMFGDFCNWKLKSCIFRSIFLKMCFKLLSRLDAIALLNALKSSVRTTNKLDLATNKTEIAQKSLARYYVKCIDNACSIVCTRKKAVHRPDIAPLLFSCLLLPRFWFHSCEKGWALGSSVVAIHWQVQSEKNGFCHLQNEAFPGYYPSRLWIPFWNFAPNKNKPETI